jgi:hypothetical protein
VRKLPVLPRDEIDRDEVDTAAEDHMGRLGFALGAKGRTVPQPLVTSLSLRNKGFGIMTEYSRAGCNEQRWGRGSRNGDGRFGVTAARDA